MPPHVQEFQQLFPRVCIAGSRGFVMPVSLAEEAHGAGLSVGSSAGDECTEAGRGMNWCTSSGCRTGTHPCPHLALRRHLSSSSQGWVLHPEHPAKGGSPSRSSLCCNVEHGSLRKGGQAGLAAGWHDADVPAMTGRHLSVSPGSAGWQPGCIPAVPAWGGLPEAACSVCTP